MRPISIENLHFGTETYGLSSKVGLNFEWSLYWNFTVAYKNKKGLYKNLY